jgi:hypothetical protein
MKIPKIIAPGYLNRYAGPDGGFRIRLSDNADAELSEGEEEDYRGGRSMIVGGPSNYSAQRALPAPPPPPEAEEEEAEGSSEEKHPMESYYSLMPPSENAENHNNRNNGTTASPLRLGVEGIEEGKVKTVAKRLDSVSRSGFVGFY